MSEDRRKNMNENIKQEAKTLEEAARIHQKTPYAHDYGNSHRRKC